MPRFRPTARLLVLDRADRVLLFSAQDQRGTARRYQGRKGPGRRGWRGTPRG